MKMSDLPALPKTRKPLNRQLYDAAWAPFAVLLGLTTLALSQAKAGFVLSGLVALGALMVSLSSNSLDGGRAFFLLAAFLLGGVVTSVVLTILVGLRKLLG